MIFKMKNTIITLLLSVISLQLTAQEVLPQWQQGWMDIHTIGSASGECSFVIMPDGTTMMIDAGDVTKNNGTKRPFPHFMDNPDRTVGERLAEYVLDFSAGLPHPEKLDYFWLTHFHKDHMGQKKGMLPGPNGYGLSGITQVGEYLEFGKIVDRGWPDYDYPSKDRVEKFNPGFMPEYRKFLEYKNTHKGTELEKFVVGSKTQFKLCNAPKKYDFEVWNVAGAGLISTGKKLKTRKLFGENMDPNLFDENMYSCVLVMRYGPFTYYNGGDICGMGTKNGTKVDCESQIADLCGPMTVINADHHGWKDSMNPYFLWKVKPKAVIIAASGANHPRPETIRRLTDPHLKIQGIFASSRTGASVCGEEYGNMTAVGHVVVRVYEGGQKWQIFVLDNKENGYKIIYSSKIMSVE